MFGGRDVSNRNTIKKVITIDVGYSALKPPVEDVRRFRHASNHFPSGEEECTFRSI